MYNKKKKVYFILFLGIFLIFSWIFFQNNFFKKEDIIKVDKDNTEIVISEKDIEEIQSRLDELDINLNDILSELEL